MSPTFERNSTNIHAPNDFGDVARNQGEALQMALYVAPEGSMMVEANTFGGPTMEERSHTITRRAHGEQTRARVRPHGSGYERGGEIAGRRYASRERGEGDYSHDGFAPTDEIRYGIDPKLARERTNNDGNHDRSRNFANQGNVGQRDGDHHWAADGELRFGNLSMNMDEYHDEDEDDADPSYLPETKRPRTFQHPARRTARHNIPLADSNSFSSPGPHHPPNFAGVLKNHNINQVPPTVSTSSISDAALLKRGLRRSKASVMSKKAHGPNDPENILIVNLKENEKKSWSEICEILNERRIKEGKSPTFTPNGCHNRYNRNAPILFAAEGKEFIPVSEQRKLKKHPSGQAIWDEETDTILIQAVKDVDSEKWLRVAELFSERTGIQITPTEAAVRTKVI